MIAAQLYQIWFIICLLKTIQKLNRYDKHMNKLVIIIVSISMSPIPEINMTSLLNSWITIQTRINWFSSISMLCFYFRLVRQLTHNMISCLHNILGFYSVVPSNNMFHRILTSITVYSYLYTSIIIVL